MAKVEGIEVVLRMYAEEDTEVSMWAIYQENKDTAIKKYLRYFLLSKSWEW